MLADSTRLGDTYLYVIGPIVLFVTLVFWIVMTLMTSRNRPRHERRDDGMPHRGPVQGGVIQGSPSQRTRRDPAPSVTHRQVMRHIEAAREAEAEEARENEAEAHAQGGKKGRKLFRKQPR